MAAKTIESYPACKHTVTVFVCGPVEFGPLGRARWESVDLGFVVRIDRPGKAPLFLAGTAFETQKSALAHLTGAAVLDGRIPAREE